MSPTQQFNEAMAGAKLAADNAAKEFLKIRHEERVRQRWARMWAARLQRAIQPPDLDLFDENDGMTESERRMWAAREKYDMREGK